MSKRLKKLCKLLLAYNKLYTRGQVGRVLNSISKGLGFDSQCWSCVEM